MTFSRRLRWLPAQLGAAGLGLFLATSVAFGATSAAGDAAGDANDALTTKDPEAVDAEYGDASESRVRGELDQKLAERRRELLKEADAALAETIAALNALEEKRNDEALAALARATGQLELVLARDPGLAFAPVDVDFVTHDLYATADAIRAAREEAAERLEEGDLQAARRLLAGLASEVVMSVTEIPLATYPDAIKAVSPLIDEGEVDEARDALQAALNTLVVRKHRVPLPVMRARAFLREAQDLVEKRELSDGASGTDPNPEAETETGTVSPEALLGSARAQLEIAELLGYMDESQRAELSQEIAKLEGEILGVEEGRSVLARVRKRLSDIQTSIFE